MKLVMELTVVFRFFLLLAGFLGLLYWVGIPFLERSSIYYPTKPIDNTPAAADIPFDSVTFPAEDGIRLSGWWMPAPEGVLARGTVLFFHGNAGNISHRLDHAVLIHRLGFHQLFFDYRGYGESAGSPSEKGLYRDALGAVRYLEKRTEVDSKRLVYYGESLGAAVAVDLAARRLPAVLVLEASFSSVPEMAKRYYPWLPVWLLRSRYDNLSKIRKITCPTLIFHSRDDEIVPLEHSNRLIEASGASVSRREVLRGGHNEAFLLEMRRISEELDRFFRDVGF